MANYTKFGAILLLFGALAIASAMYSWSRFSPGQEFLPSALASGKAPVSYVNKRLPQNLASIDTTLLADIAKTSLVRDALNPAAIRLLTLDARARQETSETLELTRLSRKLSRRDSINNIILIETLAAQPGTSVEEIIELYDLTLRIRPETSERLYPALVQVLANEEAREALVPHMRPEKDWIPGLMIAALDAEHGPAAVADMFLATYPDKTLSFSNKFSSSALFNALIKQGEYRRLRTLFLRMEEANPEWLSSMDFGLAEYQNKYGPLVWQFINRPDSGAEMIQARNGKLAVTLFATSGTRSIAMRRLVFLEPGSYRISVQASEKYQPRIVCFNEGDTKPIPLDIDLSGDFTVPQDCAAQMINFPVFGGDSQTGNEIIITRFDLTKI
ncbi:MAG: hypothetical protein AAGH53_07250 [Pseudomonadota bacterium]